MDKTLIKTLIKPPLLLLGICVFLFLESCLPPIKYSKTVREINTAHMTKYMSKKNIDTTHAYYYSLSGFKKAIDAGYTRILDVVVIDSVGQLYSVYPDEIRCEAYIKSFFTDEFELKDLRRIDDNKLYPILSNDSSLIDLNDREFTTFSSIVEEAGYTVLIFWSTQAGKNKRIRSWQEFINEKDDFQYVTINMDPHENWDWESIDQKK